MPQSKVLNSASQLTKQNTKLSNKGTQKFQRKCGVASFPGEPGEGSPEREEWGNPGLEQEGSSSLELGG